MSLSMRNPRRLLALILIPACLALAACGGDGGEEQPDTEVVVPTQTATPPAATELEKPAPGETASVAGYLVSADTSEVRLLLENGTETTFGVAPEVIDQVGIEHMASHAGLRDLGFLVDYEHKDGRNWIVGAREITPPFPYPAGG